MKLRVVGARVMGLMMMGPTLCVAQEVPNCAQIRPAVERLACYDSRTPPIAGAEVLKTREQETREDARDFGLTDRQKIDLGRNRVQQDVKRINGKVRAVDTQATGQRRVTLEDGQVWFLSDASTKGTVRPGDTIHVVKASMGTFMFFTQAGVALRAKRVN